MKKSAALLALLATGCMSMEPHLAKPDPAIPPSWPVGDAYLVLGVLALLLIPMALKLSYVPPPDTRAPSATFPVPSPSQG